MARKAIKLTVRNTADQNRKVLESAMRSTDNIRELRESVKAGCGLDILDEKNFPAAEPTFSLAAMKKKLRESASGTSFPQLLRAGVQVAFNGMVKAYTETTYEKWAHVLASKQDTELYAPLHGISFLSERGPGETFSEAQIAGLDLSLKNKEFGEILAIDQNLLDDDQTGQLQQLVGDLAEWTKLLFEVYCYGKLASVSGASYAGLSIPTSETKPSYESSYPWSTALKGGGKNKPASFAALSQPAIQAALVAMSVQKNLLGLLMAVKPKMLTVGPNKQFDAMVLMKSTLNPTAAATSAGAVGGNMAVNPIMSALEVNVTPYLFNSTGVIDGSSTAWYVKDTTKPWFVLQLRDPGSVVMENPESGESFNRKVSRHRLDVRMNADFIEPRFAYQGSDGSA